MDTADTGPTSRPMTGMQASPKSFAEGSERLKSTELQTHPSRKVRRCRYLWFPQFARSLPGPSTATH
eukprot:2376436-Pyramimonas_sp.AAC.1